MPELVDLEVRGLLGRFDHRIKFPKDQGFVILYGPNGIGKTKLLELIFATFNAKFMEVERIPFHSARFKFSDGHKLYLDRLGQQSLLNDDDSLNLSIKLESPEGGVVPWTKEYDERAAGPMGFSKVLRLIESMIPVNRINADEWHDLEQDDVVTRAELIERYLHILPAGSHPFQAPEALSRFLAKLDVHLIETQRLLRGASPSTRTGRSAKRSRATVEAFSEDYAKRMADALADNSRKSQERDRTFPRRLLYSGIVPADATEATIRERYGQQNELRARLAKISLLEQASTDLPLPDRELEDWERLVLWTYLDDSDTKLSSFHDLLVRVELFRGIVNSRFQFKQLHLGQEGFKLVGDFGNDLAVTSLSSGEQHELVLAYDLLFNVLPGSLVLIDEPEISLHVAWQQEFMNDIARIADTASLRFMVATHSPQVIHKWWDRAQSLEPQQGDAE
ncbi:AAA family ATPase [Streptomyces sp. NBC_00243]|uniref:AAA family ATPase n=1 Tax=Streptomyces sp. NBC_00243 TaxID=2975688 RepID=UPI002DD9C758|nr:AAA family ATPase [Streptomyces sp. NBC_00243]WRZ21346.1 AAA family ATPase [Streptomyces sp. NBC_00243]